VHGAKMSDDPCVSDRGSGDDLGEWKACRRTWLVSMGSNACREVALGTVTGIGRDAEGGSVARHLGRAIGPDPTEGVEPEEGNAQNSCALRIA